MLLVVQGTLCADVTVSSIFGDHMVLQREMPVPVWGDAAPGEKVVVSFAGQKVVTKANNKGHWKVELSALTASDVGRELTITGNNTVIFKDVLVGEVWICSGQSNMQFGWGDKKDPYYGWGSVKELKALIPDARTKPIRSYSVPTFVSLTPQDNCKGKWSKSPSGSAVACGFSYYLNKQLNVPVAVITTCWGSSKIEGWMPFDLTETLPHYKKMMERFSIKDKAKITALIEKGKVSGKDAKGWSRKENVYARQQPNILYNAMMHPLIPYACRGLVWYQGEANAKQPDLYAKSLPLWVKRLRKEWGRDDFYFLAVMLPGYGRDNGRPDAKSWALFREAQQKVLQLPKTGVANTIDLGNAKNIHPTDKAPLCERLAMIARRDIHGEKILGQGPKYKKFTVSNGQMIIEFTHADGLKTKDGKEPTGFWLAGKDKIWHQAKATIRNNSIALKADAVKVPVACRYAFCGKPEVNLVNKDNLPAYPFRTDK